MKTTVLGTGTDAPLTARQRVTADLAAVKR